MNLRTRVLADGIQATAVYGAAPWREDWPDADPWKVRLCRRDEYGRRRTLTVPFYTGTGLRDRLADGPSAVDVLECLIVDAASVEHLPSFEEWAGDLGYDTDSQLAQRNYRACLAMRDRLSRFLGEDYKFYLYDTDS